jgi:hypothetical protein
MSEGIHHFPITHHQITHKTNKPKGRGDEMKKEWIKPELIVLIRGKLEENVLAVCKKVNTDACPFVSCNSLNGRCDGLSSS